MHVKVKRRIEGVEERMGDKVQSIKTELDNMIKVIEETSTAKRTNIKEQIVMTATLKLEVDKLKREFRGRPTQIDLQPG